MPCPPWFASVPVLIATSRQIPQLQSRICRGTPIKGGTETRVAGRTVLASLGAALIGTSRQNLKSRYGICREPVISPTDWAGAPKHPAKVSVPVVRVPYGI